MLPKPVFRSARLLTCRWTVNESLPTGFVYGGIFKNREIVNPMENENKKKQAENRRRNFLWTFIADGVKDEMQILSLNHLKGGNRKARGFRGEKEPSQNQPEADYEKLFFKESGKPMHVTEYRGIYVPIFTNGCPVLLQGHWRRQR